MVEIITGTVEKAFLVIPIEYWLIITGVLIGVGGFMIYLKCFRTKNKSVTT